MPQIEKCNFFKVFVIWVAARFKGGHDRKLSNRQKETLFSYRKLNKKRNGKKKSVDKYTLMLVIN